MFRIAENFIFFSVCTDLTSLLINIEEKHKLSPKETETPSMMGSFPCLFIYPHTHPNLTFSISQDERTRFRCKLPNTYSVIATELLASITRSSSHQAHKCTCFQVTFNQDISHPSVPVLFAMALVHCYNQHLSQSRLNSSSSTRNCAVHTYQAPHHRVLNHRVWD